MYFQQIAVGGFDDNFSYIVGDDEGHVALIDPINIPLLLEKIKADELEVTAIFITHGHADHYGDTAELYNRLEATPTICVHPAVRPKIDLPGNTFHLLTDNEKIPIGTLKVKTFFTPGHEPGAICILADNKLMTGDTLFIGGCGRADLQGSNPHQLYDSLFNIIGSLPDDTVIYPGHDYGQTPFATLKHEKEHNKYYQCPSEEAFVKLRMGT